MFYVSHLPDTKKNEISCQNRSNYFCFPPITVIQLVSVQLPLENKLKQGKVEEKSQKDRILTASKIIWMLTSWHKTKDIRSSVRLQPPRRSPIHILTFTYVA